MQSGQGETPVISLYKIENWAFNKVVLLKIKEW